MSKILFVYPNKEAYPIIPIGISLLSGILKHHGHEADLFDVTFMLSERYDNDARERIGLVKKVDVASFWGKGENVDIYDAFRKKIEEFNPDLIAFSIVENNYFFAKSLFKVAKDASTAAIIVGGLFPTTVPRFFIKDDLVDYICVGEGERAMLELANRIDKKEDPSDIPNLIVKRKGEIRINPLGEYYDWAPFIIQDWEIFDGRHLMKPFVGKMYKTGFFELSRGCPFGCSYCINKFSQKLFKKLGRYNREKPIKLLVKEIEHLKEKHNLELVFFNDENFLTMREERLREFCNEYKKINLPFFIATRADSLLDEFKLEMLKDAGVITIGIGVESGNEELRTKLLRKRISNQVYEKAFANCHKYGIRTTANVMIGLPFETYDNILESANFCKKLQARSVSLSIFAPYYGTELRDTCVKNGFMEDRLYKDISVLNHSILTMPQISRNRIEQLYYEFSNLVYPKPEGDAHV